MNNCKCGRAVRLGASRFRVNRKQGVYHYIAHQDGTPICGGDVKWSTAMLKPYPTRDEDKPRFQMVQRWNAENPEIGDAKKSSSARATVRQRTP